MGSLDSMQGLNLQLYNTKEIILTGITIYNQFLLKNSNKVIISVLYEYFYDVQAQPRPGPARSH